MYFSLDIIVTIVYNVSKSREEIQRNEKIQFIKHYEKSLGVSLKGRSLHLRRIEISMEGSKEHGRNNGGKAYPPWL